MLVIGKKRVAARASFFFNFKRFVSYLTKILLSVTFSGSIFNEGESEVLARLCV